MDDALAPLSREHRFADAWVGAGMTLMRAKRFASRTVTYLSLIADRVGAYLALTGSLRL